MEGAARGVGVDALLKEGEILELVTEQRASNVHLLAAHNNDMLAREQLLSDLRGQTTKEMALGVNHNDLREELSLEAWQYLRMEISEKARRTLPPKGIEGRRI